MKFSGKGKKTKAAEPVRINPDGSREIPKVSQDTVSIDDLGVLRIGKKKYAVDLYRSKEPEGSIKEEASNISPVGRAETWAFYAKSPGRRLAFGSPEIGHRKGMLPLAESIRSDLLGDAWVIAIPLERGMFWVSQKENGEIISDETFEDSHLARQEVLAIASSARADRPIVAPEGWEIPGATKADLADLVGENTPPLRRFTFVQNNGARILLLALVLGIGGGSYYYFNTLEAKRIAQEKEMTKKRENRVIVNDADYPWHQKVRAESFLMNCGRLFTDATKLIPGWTAQPPVCQYADGNVVVTHRYTRDEGGRIGWLREAYGTSVGKVVLDDTGNLATYEVTEPLLASAADFSRSAPWTPENIQRVLRERFQNLGLDAKLNTTVSRAPTGQGEKPVFNNTAVEFTLPFFPGEIAGLMADVPATVPESLVWDQRANAWTLSVRVYHPAILPLGAI